MNGQNVGFLLILNWNPITTFVQMSEQLKSIIFVWFLFAAFFCGGQPLFVEVTTSSEFVDFKPAYIYGCGASAVDYDQDGDLDLYILSDENSPNRLYANDGSGLYVLVEGQLDLTMRSRTAVWFDFDGDHLLDVFIAGDCSSPNGGTCADQKILKLFRQKADGTFEDKTESSGLLSGRNILGVFGGLAAGDIDNDGFLDLVLAQWGGEVKLYRNLGNGNFSDITTISGVEKLSRYWQPLLFDLDKDGWLDIYLTVDNESNLFHRNNGDGTFKEIAVSVNLDNAHNDMGVAFGDYDNDDDFDIYITNIERERAGDHNVLLKNNLQRGSFVFDEISKGSQVNRGGWGWGTTFFDADNDGLLDIAATNGWVTNFYDPSRLWKNKGGDVFEEISVASGFNDTLQATSLLAFDMDRDGDLDLAQTLKDNPDQALAFRLLENKLDESAEFGNYLVVQPRMLGANHWAIGSTVKIRTASGIQTRPITAGISFYGQEPAEAHFGLGDLSMVEEVIIVWPGGAESSITDVLANQVITVTDEGALHAPGALTVEAESSSSINLEWGHMSTNETGFVIERSLSDSFESFVDFEVGPNVRSFLDSDLKPFTSYYYRVRATDGTLTSGASNLAKAKTESNVVIQAPTNLAGEVLSNTSVYIHWQDNADNEEGYTIHRSLSASFDEFLEYQLAADVASFENKNIEPHTTYYYRVQAYRVDGLSGFSDTLELTTIVLGHTSLESKMIVYPNPNMGSFTLWLKGHQGEKVMASMINLSGEVVESREFYCSKDLSEYQYHTEAKPGIYYLKFVSQSDISVIEVVIK
jgi:hypothetical protein